MLLVRRGSWSLCLLYVELLFGFFSLGFQGEMLSQHVVFKTPKVQKTSFY
jgi:hypothetical protein